MARKEPRKEEGQNKEIWSRQQDAGGGGRRLRDPIKEDALHPHPPTQPPTHSCTPVKALGHEDTPHSAS
jgi:hypothetical protein